MNFKKIALVSVFVALAAPLVCSYALKQYYARYESIEKLLETSLAYNDSTANAIKHAAAASDMFSALRTVIGSNGAEKTVILLGLANEYIEQVIYPNDRDTAREIMKDLHNNYVGIEAAKMADDNAAVADRLILSLANNRTLIVNRNYNPFFDEKEPKQDVVAFGYNWFDEHRAEIDSRIQMKMKRVKDLQPIDPIKVSGLAQKSAIVE